MIGMSNVELSARFMVDFTNEDIAIFQRMPWSKVMSYRTAFLADVLIMNARSRVAASPIYKEHIVMHARRMLTQGEQHRATFRNR